MYSELTSGELPLVKTLQQKLGWEYVPSAELGSLRDSYDNPFIILHLKEAIVRLNSDKVITEQHADACM